MHPGFSFEARGCAFRPVVYHFTSDTSRLYILRSVGFLFFFGLGYVRKPWAEGTQDNRATEPSNDEEVRNVVCLAIRQSFGRATCNNQPRK